MYPAWFEYSAPTTVEEAVSILERFEDDPKEPSRYLVFKAQ